MQTEEFDVKEQSIGNKKRFKLENRE